MSFEKGDRVQILHTDTAGLLGGQRGTVDDADLPKVVWVVPDVWLSRGPAAFYPTDLRKLDPVERIAELSTGD